MTRPCQYCTQLTLLVALGLSLAACHRGPEAEASNMGQAAKHGPKIASGAAPQAIAGSAAPTPTRSFTALMQALPAKEQSRVQDWYDRIGAPAMGDATPAQVAWMQANHYPMPADIVRAESMSKAELKAAGTGDTTAQILYVASLLNEYGARASAGVASNRVADGLWIDVSATMRQILASGSPYAGYLFAAQDRIMHPDTESNAATQLAGLVWASKFGDTRANALLNTPAVQAVGAATAATAINLMLKTALYGNPTLFSTTVAPLPPPHP